MKKYRQWLWLAAMSLALMNAWGLSSEEEAYDTFYKEWRRKLNVANFPGSEIVAERCLFDYAAENRSGGWTFDDGTMAGISYIDTNMLNVRVEGGALKFTMGAEKVIFGWGQLDQTYHKTYAVPLDMRSEGLHMAWKATMKSDRPPLKVTGQFCRFGKQNDGYACDLTKTGTWTVLQSDWPNNAAREESYQGFALMVAGPKGARVELKNVSAGREQVQTYCRKVFELPADDPVYSAYVNVGLNNAAFINGAQVHDKEDLKAHLEYNVVPIDIQPYLKPGTNVLALYSRLLNNGPGTYACGSVILASGREISLNMAEGWKVSPFPVGNWAAIDFDDSGWKAPHVRSPAGFSYGEYYPPLYSGPILLENPAFSKLMFSADKDVAVALKLPAGYAKETPVVNYTFTEADTGHCVASNMLNQFQPEGHALCGTLNAGVLKPGIYDLAVTCKRDGHTNLLARSVPIMVAGPVVQKEVEGYEFEEGLQLTPVDEIRCGDPNDPHPYMDSEGSKKDNRIVEKDGMVYRETGSRRAKDFFIYKLTVPQSSLFQPHVVDIVWPDNEQRSVQIGFITEYCQDVQMTIAGTTSFDKFPLSKTWQHFKCFWVPRMTNTYIVVVNNMTGFRAAVGAIKVARVDDIPAFKTHPSGERFIGQMTERNTIHGSHYSPGPFAKTLYGAVGNVPDFHRRWFRANETLIKTMRFSGENMFANGVFQYSRQNFGFAPVWRAKRSELDYNYQSMLARQFEYHGMILIPCVEYRLRDPLVNREGYKRFLQIMGDLADEYGPFKAFQGVQYICFPPIFKSGALLDSMMPCFATGLAGPVPDESYDFLVDGWKQRRQPSKTSVPDEPYEPLLGGYDDVTISAFMQATGVAIPVAFDDNERQVKRYRWIKDNCLDKWVAWRCEKIHEFNVNVADELHKRRPEAKVYPTIDFDVFLAKPIAKKGLDAVTFLRYAGYDPALAKDNPFISWPRFYNQMFHHNRSYGITDWPLAEGFNTDPKLTEFWSGAKNRSAYILTHFDENVPAFDEKMFPPEFEGLKQRVFSGTWPGKGLLMISTTFMPPGEHCLAAFRDVIRDVDPDTLFYGWADGCMPITHLQYLRRISRAFVALPGDKFTPLKGNGLDKNIVVKELKKDGKCYFYVLNDTCWNLEVELSLEGSDAVKDIGINQPVAVKDGGLAFKLLPYEMRSFLMQGSGSVKSAAAHPVPEGKSYVEGKITQLQHALSQNRKAQAVLRGPMLDNFNKAMAAARQSAGQDDLGQALKILEQGVVQDVESYRIPYSAELSSWYVIGCFPGDKFQIGFKKAYPVEQDVLAAGTVNPAKVYQGAEGYEKAVWKKVITSQFQGFNDVVVFDDLYGQPDWKEAYAFSRVYSPEERKCTLQVRSDDGIRVWLEGNLVLDHNIGRGLGLPPDKVEVSLKKGWNRVLVKLENVWSGWGFQFVFLNPDGSPYHDMPIVCDGEEDLT